MSISEELDESGLLKLQEEFLQTKSQRKPTVHLKSLKKPSLTPHPNRPLEEIPVAENHPVVGEVVVSSEALLLLY